VTRRGILTGKRRSGATNQGMEMKTRERDLTSNGVSRRRFMAGTAGAMTLAQAAEPAAAQTVSHAAKDGPHWPEGGRLAIAVTMVVETGADPDAMLSAPDGKKYPDLFARTESQYASREAIPRMIDMFDRRRIKVTSLICGQSAERFPDLAKEIAAKGHECAAHGDTHSVQYQLSREDERSFIAAASDKIMKATGQRPLGYNCRQQARSANTLPLLQELGFLYHVDDISRDEPFIVPVNGKDFAVVPYTQHLTDFTFFTLFHGDASGFAQELKREFDVLYAEGAMRRRMMAVTLHDSVARPSRVGALEEFIAYAQKQKGVWFARSDAIARFALESKATIRDPAPT
jgi:peptidoglycan/xylan/chitin deacetylase (PgdA/CDA1 family)